MKSLCKTKQGVEYIEQSIEDLQDNSVKIAVKSVGLCRTDLLVANGTIKAEDGIVLGHEFSGVVVESKSSAFAVGDRVAVNPLFPDKKFMGLDFNGCLQEFVNVPESQVINAGNVDYKIAAYVEPVAASMAVLKTKVTKEMVGAVYGKNRIAELTYIVLKKEGYNVDWLNENQEYAPSSYDYVVETLFDDESLKKIINIIKDSGTLIIKSRKKQTAGICAADLVTKELTLASVNYYDFNKTMNWLEANSDLVEHLLGESYSIENWQSAFAKAYSGESKKVFIHF